jgi:hypothetical protein
MRNVVSAVAVVVALLVGLAQPAAAAPVSGTATGTFTISDDNLTPIRTVGGITFSAETSFIQYTGGLDGLTSAADTSVQFPNGSFLGLKGTGSCTSGCTLGGRMGGFTAVFEYRGSGVQYAGTLTFTSGTGGLAGLHGGGTFWSDATGNFYSYNYHFDQ